MTARLQLSRVVVISLLTTATAVRAQDLRSRIDSFLVEQMEANGIPGLAAAVVRNGQEVYLGAHGVVEMGKEKLLTPQHVFHFASVSKPFVATAIVQLLEHGRLDLNDRVTKFLPYFRLREEESRDITIREMLNHTSGMPDVEDYEWDDPQFDEGAAERMVRASTSKSLLWSPGTGWQYSNFAYDTLGDVIAKASGTSFEAYVRANIFDPLRMSHSSFIYPEIDETLRTTGHVGEPARVSGVYPYNREHAPSSTLNSSVSEMARWLLVNLNEGELDGHRILLTESYELLLSPSTDLPVPARYGRYASDDFGVTSSLRIGLSWFLGQHAGRRIAFHRGRDTGFSSYVLLLPDDRIGVVLASNWERTDVEAISQGILHLILESGEN